MERDQEDDMRGSDAPPIEAQRRPRGDEPQSQRQQDLARKWASTRSPVPCTRLSSTSVSISAGCLNPCRVGQSEKVVGAGLGLSWPWLSGPERRQKRKSKRRPGHGGSAPGWQEHGQPICLQARQKMSQRVWRGSAGGTWALSKDGDRASEKGRCERISSKGWIEVGRFSPAPSCKDEWMVRRWQSGWASTKVWSVGTALLAGSAGKIRWVVQKSWALQKTHWSTGAAGNPS
ncbi:hypothetical protein V8C26DRAFT_137650 [Trichoderma gracile]